MAVGGWLAEWWEHSTTKKTLVLYGKGAEAIMVVKIVSNTRIKSHGSLKMASKKQTSISLEFHAPVLKATRMYVCIICISKNMHCDFVSYMCACVVSRVLWDFIAALSRTTRFPWCLFVNPLATVRSPIKTFSMCASAYAEFAKNLRYYIPQSNITQFQNNINANW